MFSFFFISRSVSDQDNTPLIVGITIPFILVLVLCLTVFVLRSRRKNVRKTTESRNADNMSLQDSIVETRYVPIFYSDVNSPNSH